MASKKLFSTVNNSVESTDSVNEAGGTAYKLSAKAALAQYICTGCFNNTYYATDKDQLSNVLKFSNEVEPEFLAKLAIYARQKSFMKDSPALLASILCAKDTNLLCKIFSRTIDSPKMLRNFMQIVRSGSVGRKSFGSRPRRLIRNYLNSLSDEQLFKANIGDSPSLVDIIKMVHPKPETEQRNALYSYLLDKKYDYEKLPNLVKKFEEFKKDLSKEVPDVPFQMLTALSLTEENWKQIALNATWNQIRMNLNTFFRHGVFKDSNIVSFLAEKLQDEKQVKNSKVFPYQLFTTLKNIDKEVPTKISIALQKAIEIACENIPTINGQVYILVDVSGSMTDPVTGNRGSVTTKTRCIDVAALFASALMKKNPETIVIPFHTSVHEVKLNPMDSIATNATILSKFGGGGTDCGIAMNHLNNNGAKGSLVIMISDNQSWFNGNINYNNGTSLANGWVKFNKRNKDSKLVCLDIQPYESRQTRK